MRGIKWYERLTSRIYPNPLTRFMSLSLSFDSCPSLNSSHTHPNKFHRCCCSTIMQIRSLFRKIRLKRGREREFFFCYSIQPAHCDCRIVVVRFFDFGILATRAQNIYIIYFILSDVTLVNVVGEHQCGKVETLHFHVRQSPEIWQATNVKRADERERDRERLCVQKRTARDW